MQKKSVAPDWRLNPGPALSGETPATDREPILIVAHVGLRGDVFGPKGHIDLGDDRLTIQGFALDSERGALEYRVRFPNLTWSDWVPEGQLTGSRGRSIPLTGFAVRLREGARTEFNLRAFGRFVGETTTVEAGDGEDCVSPNNGELRGLQVEMTPRG